MYQINEYIYGHDLFLDDSISSRNEHWETIVELFNPDDVVPKNEINFNMAFPYSGYLGRPGYVGIELAPQTSTDSFFDVSVFNLTDEVKEQAKVLLEQTVNNIKDSLFESYELDELREEEYNVFVAEVEKLLSEPPQFRVIVSTS